MNRILVSIFFLLFISFGFAQNGKILSKKLVDISKTPIWNRISQDNKLHSDFEYLQKLDFYFITYESDSLIVKGIIVEPKKESTEKKYHLPRNSVGMDIATRNQIWQEQKNNKIKKMREEEEANRLKK